MNQDEMMIIILKDELNLNVVKIDKLYYVYSNDKRLLFITSNVKNVVKGLLVLYKEDYKNEI